MTVYAQRCREAFPDANVVIGSIEASLRRIAHYDYWSDTVRRSVLPDPRPTCCCSATPSGLMALAHRLAAGEGSRPSATCAARPSWFPPRLAAGE